MEAKIRTYKQNRQKLNTLTKTMLKTSEEHIIKKFLTKQRNVNEDGFENRFIEIPENLISKIENLYIKNESELKGEIGVSDDEKTQYEGIIDLSLLILMSNKMKNNYADAIKEQAEQGKDTTSLENNKKTALLWKCQAMSDLMATIFVLENTKDGYKNCFSYGKRIDNNGKDSLAIDIPFIGQICVHFGSRINEGEVIKNARNEAISILEIKLEKGQISDTKFRELKNKILQNGILPDYESKLYEYTANIPLTFQGEKLEKARKLLGIDNKSPEEITDEDLKNIANSGINPRECYYLGVKSGFKKEALSKLSKYCLSKENEPTINEKKSILDEIRDSYTENIENEDINSVKNQMKEFIQSMDINR